MRARLAWLLLPLVIMACARAPAVLELTGSTMGTTFSVKLLPTNGEIDRDALQNDIVATLDRIERSMSTYMPESELSRLNASASTGWIEVSPELCAAIDESLYVSRLSGGAFDVTVGPAVNLWGFGPEGSVSAPPEAADVEAAMETVGHAKLHADCSKPAIRKDIAAVYVDLSAVAKGFAVDRVAELLHRSELDDYLVEVGGELRANGVNASGRPWAIAIESPTRDLRTVQTVVPLDDAAMATSGDYRNYFEYEGRLYSHTIDPRTGRPVTHDAASVTVIAESASIADAVATALLVLGPDDGMLLAEQEHIAALFLRRAEDSIELLASTAFSERTRTL